MDVLKKSFLTSSLLGRCARRAALHPKIGCSVNTAVDTSGHKWRLAACV